MSIRILQGDCREVMKTLPDNSVDSIVCDPPYHLTAGKKGGTGPASVNLDAPQGRARVSTGFMGMTWDGGSVAFDVATWAEALRVLKPGGHLLAFSGSRTYHRMVCAIEDAGFEIRDQIMWLYGSGFPKSLDVSKAIDKAAGVDRTVVGSETVRDFRNGQGRQHGEGLSAALRAGGPEYFDRDVTAPTSDEARQWQGWGTALKPAHEPIVVARKPLVGTVAANVLAHGTGALNIDACRVGLEGAQFEPGYIGRPTKIAETEGFLMPPVAHSMYKAEGRWPANVVLSWPEDEYEMRDDLTQEQRRQVYRWLHENA